VGIAALDRVTAWRTTVGTCAGGGSSLEITSDGGQTWTEVDAPVGAIARAQPLDAERGFVIGADSDCDLAQYSTQDTGETWGTAQAIDGGWSRRLSPGNEVVTPRLTDARPCGDRDVIDLSRTSAEQAEALCANGEVKVTGDGGSSWSDSGEAPGGLALSNRLEGGVLSTYVARVDDSCDGVEIVRVIKGEDARQVACVEGTVNPSPGRIAMSTVAEGGWLRVADETWTATAPLGNWAKV
jgi:hypothetical protein